MGDSARAPASIITQPSGGGAVQGLGETFTPDLHTGTGNFTVPLAIPPGRKGFQPQLSLVYSTGNGNGPFGWGWSLGLPGISRQTSRGVPLYRPEGPFVLSSAEELVAVSGSRPSRVRFRPRTEGLFARIDHAAGPTGDYWEVIGKDGTSSWYGTPLPAAAPTNWSDPAVVADPEHRDHVFAWRITCTRDAFGNLIRYRYDARDAGEEGPHTWDQPLLTGIDYVNHGDPTAERFLVHIRFEYEPRPDAFSDYRAGFEVRTARRCRSIRVETDSDAVRAVRRYDFTYRTDPANGVSLLSAVVVSGFDDQGQAVQELPPLTFEHTSFEPGRRRFTPLSGSDLPAGSLAREDLELVDLFGSGLPDLLQMDGTTRYWRNLGDGRFDLPRPMRTAPAGLSLADKRVQLLDANGNGRADLLVTAPGRAGYFPMRFDGTWHRDSFHRYRQAPSFDLSDPHVRLIDLDGDGVTDAIRSGTRLECFFQDRDKGWNEVLSVERSSLDHFPDVDLADPRVRWADMTGDGVQDIVLFQDGNVSYWPNLGRGRWGKRVTLRHSPRLPSGYDPARVLFGDVDGDGLADLVYVGHDAVRLWINHSGDAWSREPMLIRGTPPAGHTPSLRLADVFGTGAAGVLWSTDAVGGARSNHWFLDFTGGTKPYLLACMRNNLGAVTRVEYAPSSRFLVADRADARTQWRTPLPFPVQVVARVEVIDEISGGKLTTEYRYRHGYWGGADREFRGFGMVEQRDSESFDRYDAPGLHAGLPFASVARRHFAAPTMTRTWFHQGDVEDADGEWAQPDYSAEYWQGDPQLLGHERGISAQLAAFAQSPVGRVVKRDALRALRGSVLRSELYALDGSAREGQPYTVTEHSYGVEEVVRDDETRTGRVFLAYPRARRTTQWERGDDPMTQFTFLGDYDAYGQPRLETRIACPRGWRTMDDRTTEYLATRVRTVYATPQVPSQVHIVDRVARSAVYALAPAAPCTVAELSRLPDDSAGCALMGQTLHHYDGAAFTGLPQGAVGRYGALVRTEELVLTEKILQDAYGAERPPYLVPGETPAWTGDYPQEFRDRLVRRAGYVFRAADAVYEEGYFTATERRRYDFHDPVLPPRGLVTAYRPALGTDAARDTRVSYDSYGLLPAEVTDPVGMTMKARYDYRLLKVRELTDANGTTSSYTYTPLGLLATTRVTGKAGEGDRQHPSVTHTMDLRAFERHGRPRVHPHQQTGAARRGRDDRRTRVLGRVRTPSPDPDPGRGHPVRGQAPRRRRCSRRPGWRARDDIGTRPPDGAATQRRRERTPDLRQQGPRGRELGTVLRRRLGSRPASGRHARHEGDLLLRSARHARPDRAPGRVRAARGARRPPAPRHPRSKPADALGSVLLRHQRQRGPHPSLVVLVLRPPPRHSGQRPGGRAGPYGRNRTPRPNAGRTARGTAHTAGP
ncbi:MULTISPECIES: SpvB/TcaC N-terminal domain-containing protein [unclassified Streptomyces]|uniref:SpvB/TcaC N-terminal domain-containing protein n=1 Tax=unclassified Streptomyces TaxID=2593676 RepID=UPI0025B3D18F|nr:MULTISPECIES: SpvB/TcaC N-terminal domain-containing protein [unclassified Streptomyces]MDN3249777.1 SpvB/TcaC N-terminal domain-containing protein [Streptomyces sp. ZSW22]MDN3258046.1 SpvB/TcaC N-terminal domain-containing protein [Streptomyces sp. MA25(2023)]